MKEIRLEINKQDFNILKCLEKRMNSVLKILYFKLANNFKILDLKREREILENIAKNSSTEFKKYFFNIFLNIISCSKLLQFEKCYEKFNFLKEQKVNKKNGIKNLAVVYNNVEDFILKNKILSKFSFFKTKTINEAAYFLNSKKCYFLIIKENSKKRHIFNFIRNNNFFIFEVFCFKKQKYLILTKKIFFRKGQSNVFFSFETCSFRNDFINLTNILTLNNFNILNLKTLKKRKGFIIYVKISSNFKEKKLFLNLIRILNYNFKNFKLYGLYRKLKIKNC